MKKRANPLLFGIGGALFACLALIAGPAPASAQTKPPNDKKDGNAAKQPVKADKAAAKPKPAAQLPPRPHTLTRQAHQPAKRLPGNQIPEPTVKLKPGEVPGIKFDMLTYDFGRIRAGGDVVHDFWFTNTGNGPLEILRVKPG